MGNVGDEIAAALLHALGLSKITEHGDGPTSGHRRRGDIENAAGSDGVRARGSHNLIASRFLNPGKKLRVADAVNHRRIQAGGSNQPTSPPPILPCHPPLPLAHPYLVPLSVA